MRFEIQNALRDLDRRTPDYFLGEIFHHGSLKLKTLSVEALRDLGPNKTSRKLRAMLTLTP
jgi:hypothetical protein